MDNINQNEKEGIGITLKIGIQQKRLWFSVGKDDASQKEFKEACREIEAIGDKTPEWTDFLNAVKENFAKHGFERIAK